AGPATPFRLWAAEPRGDLRPAGETRHPSGGRDLTHAAEQSCRRPRAQEHEAVATQEDERRSATQPSLLFRRLDGKGFGIAAAASGARAHPGTEHTGGRFRRADGGPEIHQRLRKIAGALGRYQSFREPADLGLGRGQLVLAGEEPRPDSLRVAVARRG